MRRNAGQVSWIGHPTDGLAKREIAGEHLDCLQQTLTILVQQAAQLALADVQFLGIALARNAAADGIDKHAHAGLHDRERQGESRAKRLLRLRNVMIFPL
jgi:hypothetical protein